MLCVGLIILIIVLVRRSGKKKRAQQQQQWGPGGPGGPGYGQPQYPQQYGQPPSSTANPSTRSSSRPRNSSHRGGARPPVSNLRPRRASRPAQANNEPCGSRGSGGTKRSTPVQGRWSMNTQLRRWIALGPMPRSATLWRGHG